MRLQSKAEPDGHRVGSQIAVERSGMSREFGAVQQDTARAPQTPDRSTLGVGEPVIGPAPCIIQLLASRRRKPAPGLWIDILRIHSISHHTRPRTLMNVATEIAVFSRA